MPKTQKRLALTVEQIKKIYDIWDDKSAAELCEMFGIERFQLYYIAKRIRTAGYPLLKKRIPNKLDTLIKKALGDPKKLKRK